MLKCVILLISLILKKVAVTLTQLHAQEEKNMGFLHFCLRTYITLLVLKHHCLILVWSWEKIMLKCAIFC